MAAQVIDQLKQMQKKGPKTIIGKVADTRFQLTQGYVTCQTDAGIVQVTGVPLGSVVPGMRIFCRQMGAQSTRAMYIFDGYASALASLGTTGSLMLTSPSFGYPVCASSTNGVATTSTITTGAGYYWHFFFYLPQLPSTYCTLLYMVPNGTGPYITMDYYCDGTINISDYTGYGFHTNVSIPPHQMHWMVIQPGVAGQQIMIDGLVPSYYNTPTMITVEGGTAYTLYLMSKSDGSQVCPLGSWMSKIGYGVCALNSSSPAVQLPTSIPEIDSDITDFGSIPGITPMALYLCEDQIGGSSLANSVSSSLGAVSGLSGDGSATVVQTGPY